MPNYDFRCTDCKVWWEEQLLVAERENPLSEPCPGCGKTGFLERFLSSAPIWKREGVEGKVPNAFKDILKKIKKENIRSTINTQ